MDLSKVVPETKSLTEARRLMRLASMGLPKPEKLPFLTDQECVRLSQETEFSYDAIRKAFPKRY